LKKNLYLFNSFTKEDLKNFLSHVSIYRKGYNYETKNGTWIHIDKYLSDDMIVDNFLLSRKNRARIAYSSCYMTNFFVLDVDCHKFYGNNYFVKKNIYLYNQYSYIKSIFGLASLIYATPRGMHLYFFLKEKISVDVLHEYINDKLKTAPRKLEVDSIDIKPGVDSFLRCPVKSKLLRNTTLDIYNKNTKFSTIMNNAPIYSIGELFEEQINSKKVNLSNFTEKEDYSIIYAGHTNEAMNYLIPLWKNHGMTNEECTNMFISRLDSSYSGDCKSFNHVLKRVSCYNKHESPTDSTIDYDTIYKKNKKCIDSAIAISNGRISNSYNRNIRSENIKKIMCAILSIQDRTNKILNDKRLYYKQISLNSFYAYETKKSRIPISSKALKAIVSNYEPILSFLKEIRFISDQSTYSVIHKSCIYYHINLLFYSFIYKDYNTYNRFIKNIINNNRLKVVSFSLNPRYSSNMFVPSRCQGAVF